MTILTPDRIQAIRKAYQDGGSTALSSDEVTALCAVALAWLDLQPRPISEAPKDGSEVLIFDEAGLIVAFYSRTKKKWGDGLSQPRNPTHFIPLSVIPQPDIRRCER